MKLPPSLERQRDELAEKFAENNSVLDKEPFPYGWGFQEGFDAGALAALNSPEVMGLVETLERVNAFSFASHTSDFDFVRKALIKFKEWSGK